MLMKNDNGNRYAQHEHLYKLVFGHGVDSIEGAVQRLFFALGFKNKLIGTTYLREAVGTWCDMPTSARVVLTADIYPNVARKFNSTAGRVERAIRNTLLDCYSNGRLIFFNDLVQSDVISAQYPPTNGEFLSSVVSWLRIQFRDRYRQLSFL